MSKIVSSISARQAGRLCALLEKRGIDDYKYQTHLIEGIDDLVAWIGDRIANPKFTKSFEVDYSMDISDVAVSMTDRNDAIGCEIRRDLLQHVFKYFNNERNDRVRVETALLHYCEDIGKDALEIIQADCDRLDAKPATLHTLVRFAESFPKKRANGTIIALGTLIQRYENELIYPHLCNNEFGFGFHSKYDYWGFSGCCQFLIEREIRS